MNQSSPPILNIVKGELVNHSGQEFVILKVISLTQVLAQSIANKTTEVLEIQHLTPWSAKQDDQKDKQDIDLTIIPEHEWELARERLSIIKPLLSRTPRGSATAAQIAKKAGYGIATLYRWVNSYKNSGLLSDLLLDKPGWKTGKFRLGKEVEAIIDTEIQNHLTDQKLSIASTIERIRTLCENAGLPKPHWETVSRRINAIPERERFAKRYSERAAQQIFDPNEGTIPNAEWPLALTQIDHTLLPVMVVHEVTRRSIGRPWVTFDIDVYSRMIPGMYLSLDAPSAMSTGLCLSHAILPKEKWLAEDIGLPDIDWPSWGVMGILHMDNAKEFRGNAIKDACLEYGIDPQFRPVKTPRYGGHIERYMGNASENLKKVEGATFSNPKERGDYDSEGNAILTMHELEQWLVVLIAKYHHSPHEGIGGEAPIDRYRKGLLGGNGKLPRGLPARRLDAEKVRIDFMPFEERTVQNYGVVIDDIYYFADVLRPWVNSMDQENPKLRRIFKFRRDPRDISRLYFFDPNAKRYYVIPYRNASYPPISIWELRDARAAAKASGIKKPDEATTFRFVNQLREIQEQAGLKTKVARRADQRSRDHAKARKKTEKNLPNVIKTEAPAMPPVIPGYNPNRTSVFEDDDE